MFVLLKEKIKQSFLFLLCRMGVLSSGEDCVDGDADIIDAASFTVRPLCDTTNNVIYLSDHDNGFYFREWKEHSRLSDYIESVNSDYKYFGNANTVPVVIDEKKFLNMGLLANQYSNVRRFYETHDLSLIGLKEDGDEMSFPDVKKYVDYSWSEVYNYKLNCGKKNGQLQNYNGLRAISFYKIAKLLGADALIPETKPVRIKGLGEKDRFGTLMNAAGGISFNSIAHSDCRKNYTFIMQKNLLNLQILDTVCYEKDHRPDNYNVVLNKAGQPESVCAFDNDSPMSFFITGSVSFSTYEGCSPLIDGKGFINRPFLDAEICEKLFAVSEKEINAEFEHILSKCQIKCLIKRIKRIRKSIRISVSSGKCSLLHNDSEWNETTAQAELSGEYGLTYLGLFSSDWVNTTVDNPDR